MEYNTELKYNTEKKKKENIKVTKVFFTKCLDKQTVVHPENEILFNNKKNEQWRHKKTWKKFQCILLSEEAKPESLHTV